MIRDENGKEFKTLKEACRHHSVVDNGWLYLALKTSGKAETAGHTFTVDGYEGTEPSRGDLLLEQMRQHYTDEELERIASGIGLAKPVDYPSITLHGDKHRIMVLSDTHIGSKFSPYEWHDIAARAAEDMRCECVLHCGDLTEGMRIQRIGTQMYELTDLGFEAQRDRAVELMSKYTVPVFIISGNHDAFFQEYAGADVVRAVCERVEGMTYLGYDVADIDVGGVTVRLWHGGDGGSYALSYRLQKVIESMTGGTKPGILLAGHVHKFCYIFERNVHAISCPSMQMQTNWMRGKKLASHTGFLVLDFETHNGCVCNLSVRLYPFYA